MRCGQDVGIDPSSAACPTAAHSFTSRQISAIHTRLKRYSGVIRWGGDYTGRKDPMHFEINRSVATTHRVKVKLFPCTSPVC